MKTTLFNVFSFLSDCLRVGVQEACDGRGRGGFHRIRSQGEVGPISFELYYRESLNSRPITFELSINADKSGTAYVESERLRQRRSGQKKGAPFSFLNLRNGSGVVWSGEKAIATEKDQTTLDSALSRLSGRLDLSRLNLAEVAETEKIEILDQTRLAVGNLGVLRQHPRIIRFRNFVENWYLSFFMPSSARGLPISGPQKKLNADGSNLANYVQFLEDRHPDKIESILEKIAVKIPGLKSIQTSKTEDQRLLLKFCYKDFDEGHLAQFVSDGTVKLFSYLALLEDPNPPSFLGIEEVENGVYIDVLPVLMELFREYCGSKTKSTQVFLTTHQPLVADSLEPDELWIMKKEDDGFSQAFRASKQPHVAELVKQGLPMGELWSSNYIG